MKTPVLFFLTLLPGLLAAQVGPFDSPVAVTPQTNNGRIQWAGDLNNDGSPDLLLLFDEYIWVENRGDGTFHSPRTTNAPFVRGHNHCDVADFNGDRIADILFINDDTQEVGFFLATNNRGSYSRRIIGTAPDRIADAAAGDMDGDGDIDVVYTDGDDLLVMLLRNRGNGTFDPVEIIHQANGQPGRLSGIPNPITLGDYNGDGRLDIAGRTGGDGKLWELRNTPTGFQPRNLSPIWLGNVSFWAMHAADVDQDGDDDIVFGSRSVSGNPDSEYLGFFRIQAGAGQLQKVYVPTGGRHWYFLSLGDYDQDGDIDIVRNDDDREGLFYHEFRNGSFGPSVELAAPGTDEYIPATTGRDFDGDGDQDLAIARFGRGEILLYSSLARHEAVINSFTTNQNRIPAGQSAVLSWAVDFADRIQIDPGVGTVTGRTSVVVRPTTTTTYTLLAFRGSNESNAQVTIEVFQDTDSDGLDDNWERAHFGSLAENASGDPDGDLLNNGRELQAGTDPNRGDTDGDGLGDGAEVDQHGTDPLVGDSEGDDWADGVEVAAGTDPLSDQSTPSALLDGLVIYSPLDATLPSGKVRNLVRPGSEGSLTGAATLGGTGVQGGSLLLTGAAADGVEYPAILEAGDGSFSVALWFRASVANPQGLLVENAGGAGTTPWSVTLSGSAIEVEVGGEKLRLEGVQSGIWHHAVISFDGPAANFRAALDGTVSPPQPLSGISPAASPGNVVVGGGAGAVDELAVWTRPLSDLEVEALGAAPGMGLTVAASSGPAAQPSIQSQPVGTQAYTGQDLEMTVSVTGLGPFTFEWNKDGAALGGQTDQVLRLEDVVPGDSGDYTVTIRGVGGEVTSAPAELIVVNPVPIFRKGLQAPTARLNFGTVGSDLCGDLLVIGSPVERFHQPNERGSVHLYQRDAGGEFNWGQIAHLVSPAGAIDPHGFGHRVAIDRDTIAVGSAGTNNGDSEVYVYEVRPGGVVQVARIPDNPDDEDFGVHLGLFGDTLAVSAWNGGEGRRANGRVHVYQRQEDGSWPLQRTIMASASTLDDGYGTAVALSEDTLAVGAPGDWDGQRESGAVYVYERHLGGPDQWGERHKLKGSGVTRFGAFGTAVSISGDTMAIGAHLTQDEIFVDFVFERAQPGSSWMQRSRSQYTLHDWVRTRQQENLSISGDYLVSVDSEGELFYLRGRNTPSVGAWGQVQVTGSPPLRQFEQSVAISGDVIFVGPDNIFEQPAVGPSIKHHPAALSVRNGERVEFGVFAVGSRPLSIQWFKDGVEIPGATGATFEIPSVTPGDPALYHAVVTNPFGEATSRRALLESDVPASILTQPGKPVRGDDGSFKFEVGVEGTDVMIQWLKNGVPIPGANQATLVLADPQFDDAAVYSVRVWNTLATVTSDDVELPLEEMMPLELAKFRPAPGGWGAGFAVDLFGSRAIVGATNTNPSGAAYIYEFDTSLGSWRRVAEIRPTGGGSQKFGQAVAISDDLAVVGDPRADAPGNLDAGQAYIFRRTSAPDVVPSTWVREAILPQISHSPGWQGQQVAISGGEVFVASNGRIQQFTHTGGGQWVERSTIRRPSPDGFGRSMAIHNGVMVVGAQYDGTEGEDAGSAYVFEETFPGSGQWRETARLFSNRPSTEEHFGVEVAVHGGLIAVGAIPGVIGGSIGSVYLFERDAGGWSFRQKLQASDGQLSDSFGSALALHGNQLLVGAHLEDSQGSETGAVYLFEEQGGTWIEKQKVQAFDAEAGASFGISVALESGNAVVGAIRTEDSGGAYLLRVAPTVLSVSSDGVPAFNPQTGLYELGIVIRNESTGVVPAMEVTLDQIPAGVTLHNATGENGTSIHFDSPIAGLGTVEMALEFYVANRQPPAAPLFSVASAVAIGNPPTAGNALAIGTVHAMPDGGILVDFVSTPGRRYRVQYSPDMVNWRDAEPTVVASGTRVQWHDQGPPMTVRHPSEDPVRYYRVIELAD